LISPRWIRRIVLVVCALAIAGMIVASITSHNGVAIALGTVAAVAVICLMLVTAVAGPEAFGRTQPVDEAAAADLERRVEVLVANGADEEEVRSLIRAVRRMSRRS
jgi:vacuolar-type H+-ATPase subunit D/Vma8